MSDKVDQLVNPECRELVIGTRKTRTIIVYPLAFYDQKMIGQQVMNYLGDMKKNLTGDESLDITFIGKLAEVIEENIPVLIDKCTDEKEKAFMRDVSAGQLMEFITIIMEVNFLNPIKKGTNLFTNMGSLYGANPSLPQSVKDTDID